jgi:hypothetical protein
VYEIELMPKAIKGLNGLQKLEAKKNHQKNSKT